MVPGGGLRRFLGGFSLGDSFGTFLGVSLRDEQLRVMDFEPAQGGGVAGQGSRQATMLLTKPVHDACLVEIVGGYLKFNEIARGKADEPLPHLSRDVGEYEMFISKRDPKHSSGQHGDNLSFGFNRTLHWQFEVR